jgi:hypothetical protein
MVALIVIIYPDEVLRLLASHAERSSEDEGANFSPGKSELFILCQVEGRVDSRAVFPFWRKLMTSDLRMQHFSDTT